MISGSFTTQTKVHADTASGDPSSSLPLITTGSVSLPSHPSNSSNAPVGTSESTNTIPSLSSLPTRERRRSLSVDLVNQPSSMLLRDRNSAITVFFLSLSHIRNKPITSNLHSILILDRVLMITQRLFRVYSTLIQRHSSPLLSLFFFSSLSVDALGSMASAEVMSPSITSQKQYLQYLRVLCSSLTAYIAFLRSFNQASPDRLEIIYQRTIQILINFPRESVLLPLLSHPKLASSDIALQILELLIDPKLNLTSLVHHLPYLLTGDVLFPLQLSVCENSSLIEHRLQIVNDILLTRKNKLRLVDIQNIAYIYSFYFGNPLIAFRTLRRMTFSLTELVKSLRQYTVTQRDIVSTS